MSAAKNSLDLVVGLIRLRVWEVRFAIIAWRRWRSWRCAWQCAIASDDDLDDRESPRDAVLTEESYAD